MTNPRTLLEAMDQAMEADRLEQRMPELVRQVEQGLLSLEPPSGESLFERLVFDYGIIASGILDRFQPLLEAVSQRGHGPWGPARWHHFSAPDDSLYHQFVADLTTDEFLCWCWSQPGAPEMTESTVERQVRSDRLAGLLREYPPGHVSHERKMQEEGFDLSESWATGKTTFQRVVESQWVRLPAQQKEFEWTNTLRRFRQLAKAAAKQCPADHRFLALVPACLAAERAWCAHQDAHRFSRREDRPDWAGTWLETLKDLAPSQGGKRGTPLQGWEAFMAWSVQSAPPSVEVVGAVAAGWRVLASWFPEDFSAKSARLALVDTVTQGLERIGVDNLLASRSSLEERYPLAHAFWQNFEGGIGKKEGQEEWEPDELWKVVLPLVIKDDPEKSLSAFFTRRMEKHLPKGEAFQWPNVPFWNQVVATWGWSEPLRAQARAQGLEQRLEDPSGPPPPTRGKPRL
jgi:hypothetical protein